MHNMDILQVAIGNEPTGLPKLLFPRGLKVFTKRNRNFMNNKSKAVLLINYVITRETVLMQLSTQKKIFIVTHDTILGRCFTHVPTRD